MVTPNRSLTAAERTEDTSSFPVQKTRYGDAASFALMAFCYDAGKRRTNSKKGVEQFMDISRRFGIRPFIAVTGILFFPSFDEPAHMRIPIPS
jgi:hypothetical protein